MLECFLVVALFSNGNEISRNLSMHKDIPKEQSEFIMSVLAGRKNPAPYREGGVDTGAKFGYGYDCGSGWVNKGVRQDSVFAKG